MRNALASPRELAGVYASSRDARPAILSDTPGRSVGAAARERAQSSNTSALEECRRAEDASVGVRVHAARRNLAERRARRDVHEKARGCASGARSARASFVRARSRPLQSSYSPRVGAPRTREVLRCRNVAAVATAPERGVFAA